MKITFNEVKFLLAILICFQFGRSSAQENRNSTAKKDSCQTTEAFRSFKVSQTQSTKQAEKGTFYLSTNFRFGSLNRNFDQLFGMDNITAQFGVNYGFTKFFQMGLSRESLGKMITLSSKFRIYQKGGNFPLNLSIYGSYNFRGVKHVSQGIPYFSANGLFFQPIISTKLFNRLSLQLSPSFMKMNDIGLLVFENETSYALSISSAYWINEHSSIFLDYSTNLNRHQNSPYKDVLSLGAEIEFQKNLFRFLISNSSFNDDISSILTGEKDKLYIGVNYLREF